MTPDDSILSVPGTNHGAHHARPLSPRLPAQDEATVRRAIRRVALAAIAVAPLIAAPPSAEAARRPRTCDPALVTATIAAVRAACPCSKSADGSAWGKHRHYKKCVRQAIQAQVRASSRQLRRRCLRETWRCANTSTCGTAGAVTCTTPDRCSIRASAAACDAAGAILGTGSCCAPMPLG
jgi:hypothetical protein